MFDRPAVVLEPAARQPVEAAADPPSVIDAGPDGARKIDDLQSGPVETLPVTDEWVTVPAAAGDVRVRIVKPVDAGAVLPVVVYVHGGGGIPGNAATHDRLVRELVVGAHAAVAFVVLRDEGDTYAAKHRSADVPVATVRHDGTVHDLMLLNSLTDTRATRASGDRATGLLRAALAAK